MLDRLELEPPMFPPLPLPPPQLPEPPIPPPPPLPLLESGMVLRPSVEPPMVPDAPRLDGFMPPPLPVGTGTPMTGSGSSGGVTC